MPDPVPSRPMLVVLTGASGTGKTSVVHALSSRPGGPGGFDLGGRHVPVLDADDFIGLCRTTEERRAGLRRMVRFMAAKGGLCFCAGQIPPADMPGTAPDGPEVTWLWLTVAEDRRLQRLADAGWRDAAIAEHRAWLDEQGFEAGCEAVAARRIDATGLSPDQVADRITSWMNTSFGGAVPDYAAWAAEAPGCGTLEELAGVVARHPQLDYADLYHPLPFEAFDGLRTAVDKRQFAAKVEQIGAAVASLAPLHADGRAPPRVVDIGANGGAVSIPLARAGYEVTAVEPDGSFVELGRRACTLAGVPMEWVRAGLDGSLLPNRRFDVALVLSVFQWAARGGEALEEAGQALRALTDRCHGMVFELGFNAGTSCLRTDETDHARVLLRLLLDHTGYSDFELLGGSELYPGQPRFIYCCKGRRPRLRGA